MIGSPISHSLSPYLHRYWLEELKIQGLYLGLRSEPEDLGDAVRGLRALNFVGYNVTIPHKETIIAHLDDLDEKARKVGAVNTVVIKDGRSTGLNSDVEGFISHLDVSIRGSAVERVLVLGSGGAARAVVVGLLDKSIESVYVVNRSRSRAERLERDFKIKVLSWSEIPSILPEIDLLVNTTVLGMRGYPRLEIDLSRLPQEAWVYDIVYRPLKTDLLNQAQGRGLRIIDGLGMLLYQGCLGFERWFGVRPEVTLALRGYMEGVIE